MNVLYHPSADVQAANVGAGTRIWQNAVVLEELAFMAWHNKMMNPAIPAMQQELRDKHYLRKHGANAYYGQKK